MVVSCRFRYGTLVIGTGSMTGTINKGDIIIYERYEKEELEIGEIIVFKTENVFVIHRIIDKKSVGEEIRYYTKGDANQQGDKGFSTQKNIVGIVTTCFTSDNIKYNKDNCQNNKFNYFTYNPIACNCK